MVNNVEKLVADKGGFKIGNVVTYVIFQWEIVDYIFRYSGYYERNTKT